MKKKQKQRSRSKYYGEARRRQSRVKNLPPKKSGPGRPKGVPNKINREFKDLLQPLETEGIKKLQKMMKATEDPDFLLAAMRFVSEYRHGRPKQPVEASGPDGGPIPIDWFSFLQKAHSYRDGGGER